MGCVVSEVISQVAATSFIHMQTLAISQVIHSMRNTGRRRGARVDRCAGLVDMEVKFKDLGPLPRSWAIRAWRRST